MHYIGKSKISKLHPQPNTVYPLIRLPQQCNDVIGETAHIFQTEYQGEKAFFILLRNKETTKRKIIKEFIKSKPEIDLKSHLIIVESKIDEILKLLFSNQNLIEVKSQKNNGLEAIRTPDLRHVKAPNCLNSLEPHDISSQLLCIQSCLSGCEPLNTLHKGLGASSYCLPNKN
jgi:hypothetical protein